MFKINSSPKVHWTECAAYLASKSKGEPIKQEVSSWVVKESDLCKFCVKKGRAAPLKPLLLGKQDEQEKQEGKWPGKEEEAEEAVVQVPRKRGRPRKGILEDRPLVLQHPADSSVDGLDKELEAPKKLLKLLEPWKTVAVNYKRTGSGYRAEIAFEEDAECKVEVKGATFYELQQMVRKGSLRTAPSLERPCLGALCLLFGKVARVVH